MKGWNELEGGRHAPSNHESVVKSLKAQQYNLGGMMTSSEEGAQGEGAPTS